MSCKKYIYRSHDVALGAAMKRLKPSQPNTPKMLRPYWCNECKGWHLTKMEFAKPTPTSEPK